MPSRLLKCRYSRIFIEASVTGLWLAAKGRIEAPPLSKPKLTGAPHEARRPGQVEGRAGDRILDSEL
ncbi:hypothetical protein ACFXA0_03425 [Streptomyces cyaneofuscatus]|uniref:hypothetical protein n=1 Tax=Streptomyces TaxID=1883 RepID=UPI001F3155CF|nr:hypothetical protein [Streptomyces sp. SID2119]